MNQTTVKEIDRRLTEIIGTNNVSIPLAVESGSRAWGFPSPDSDYDCRFIFIRSFNRSFTLFPERDVIETPVTPIFDVGGWELSKALKLLLRGNVVIAEWLASPFTYRLDAEFRDDFLGLVNEVASRQMTGRHYYHLAANQISTIVKNPDHVALKKLFYAMRPMMALKWLENHPAAAVAPMNFLELRDGTELPGDLQDVIETLLALKAETRELGEGATPLPVKLFLENEFAMAEKWRDAAAEENPAAFERVDAFWRHWVERLAPPNR